MHRCSIISLLIVSLFHQLWSIDVCQNGICKCSKNSNIVNCDSKGWTSLEGWDFPSDTVALTLVNNHLKFDSMADRLKIESLTKLNVFSLNQNPLGIIPPFGRLKLLSFSLQDTSLISAKFPSSYENSLIQFVSLSHNKIQSIHADDFSNLHASGMTKLHLDDVELQSIDPNALTPLNQLQALSLKRNHLKSCEFLSTLPLLSSIKLDENSFMSLPQQLSLGGNIKDYSFTSNNISTIDTSSPLNVWFTQNFTNRQISLYKNPFDCCSSQWFIRFIQSATHFVSDSSILECNSPKDVLGKKLIEIDLNQLNCDGSNKSWWTTFHIGIVSGISLTTLLIVPPVVIFYRRRRKHRRSGYQEIPGNDENLYDDINEAYSAIRPGYQAPSIVPSETPTQTTNQGVYANDGSSIYQDDVSQRAAVPSDD